MTKVETIKYKGHDINVYYDTDPESPRNWEPLGHIVYKNRSYILGDESIDDPVDWLAGMLGLEEEQVERIADKLGVPYHSNPMLQNLFSRLSKDFIALPVYSYIHSGVTISTGSFGCPWDSGQSGVIYVSKEKVREDYGVKRISPKLLTNVLEILEGEIETFDQYLTGEVYGFQVEGDVCDDSCWGYFGDEGMKYMIDEAKSSIDHAIASNRKHHYQQLKTWIRNKVGLVYRTENNYAI